MLLSVLLCMYRQQLQCCGNLDLPLVNLLFGSCLKWIYQKRCLGQQTKKQLCLSSRVEITLPKVSYGKKILSIAHLLSRYSFIWLIAETFMFQEKSSLSKSRKRSVGTSWLIKCNLSHYILHCLFLDPSNTQIFLLDEGEDLQNFRLL